jgi:biotin synthase
MINIYGQLGKQESLAYDFSRIKNDIKTGQFNGLSTKEDLLRVHSLPLDELVGLAVAIRTKRKEEGTSIDYCTSGYLPHNGGEGCEMSCSFCGFPQGIYEKGSRQFVSKLSEDAIIKDAKKKKELGATRYKIVVLGCTIKEDEYKIAVNALPRLFEEIGLEKVCLSFGILTEKRIEDLINKFGTKKIEINHNLEVGSKEAYKRLIGTHELLWDARYNTILNARKYGLNVCAGGLIGIGETIEDQVDLVIALRSLNVTSTPFNVFVMDEHDKSVVAKKIKKGNIKRPTDEELLRILGMWRLGLPKSSIAANSGFGLSRDGDFGIYSGIVELALINDKVSLPDVGVISKRRY